MTQRQLLINELFKLVAMLENKGDFIFSQVGLTVKTYGVLYLISTGLDTSKNLLNGTYGSKPNMAKKIKFLEQNGFIERSIDKIDKRVFRLSLKQKALVSLEKISPIYEENISRIFSGIDDLELIKSMSTISKIMGNILN